MGETAHSRSAPRAAFSSGAGSPSGGAGLTIRQRRPLTIVQIAEIPGVAGPCAAIERAVGMTLPPARRSASAGERSALWVGPGRWFIVEPRADDLATDLDRAVMGAFAVTDLSHARTVLRLSGANVVDVLAQGCAVDLHPRSLAVGDSIVAGVARHAALLHVVDVSPTIDIYVYRSFGQDLFESLTGAAAA